MLKKYRKFRYAICTFSRSNLSSVALEIRSFKQGSCYKLTKIIKSKIDRKCRNFKGKLILTTEITLTTFFKTYS